MSTVQVSNSVKAQIQLVNDRTKKSYSLLTSEETISASVCVEDKLDITETDNTQSSTMDPQTLSKSSPTTTINRVELENSGEFKKTKTRTEPKETKPKRVPNITPLETKRDEERQPKGGTNPATKHLTRNLLDNAAMYLNMDNLQQLITAGASILQTHTAAQESFDSVRTFYQTHFKEDMRPFYGIIGVVGLIFFFFILQPILLVLRFGVFGFVCYSSYLTVSNSVVATNETTRPFGMLGYGILVWVINIELLQLQNFKFVVFSRTRQRNMKLAPSNSL